MEAFYPIGCHSSTGSDVVLGPACHILQQLPEAVCLSFTAEPMFCVVWLTVLLLHIYIYIYIIICTCTKFDGEYICDNKPFHESTKKKYGYFHSSVSKSSEYPQRMQSMDFHSNELYLKQ